MSLDNYTRLINNYGLNKKNTKDKKIVPTTTKPLDVYQKQIGNNTVAGNGVGNRTVINKEPETVVGTTPTTTPETTNSATTNTTAGTTPAQTTGSSYVDDSWKVIQQQIKMNTLNSKNEVAMAQRQASKNMDNYLKSLGIYGTGLGQSSYVDLATQYANQLAEINDSERTALLEAQQAQTDDVKKLIEDSQDPMVVQQIIEDLKSQGFNTSEIERYQKAMGQDIETYAKSLYGTMLEEMKLEDFKGDKAQYTEAITMLENAITSGDSKAMSEAYDYAYNVSNGTPNLNVKADKTEVLTTDEEYTEFSKPTKDYIKTNINEKSDIYVYNSYYKLVPKFADYKVVSVNLEDNYIKVMKKGTSGSITTTMLLDDIRIDKDGKIIYVGEV